VECPIAKVDQVMPSLDGEHKNNENQCYFAEKAFSSKKRHWPPAEVSSKLDKTTDSTTDYRRCLSLTPHMVITLK
jgi:hypothetical protein